MRGTRLVVARNIAKRTFKNLKGFNPRNESQIGFHNYVNNNWTEDELQRVLGIYRKTKVTCSCYMCGNPRRYWHKITRQEIKQHLNADAECAEIGYDQIRLRWQRGTEEY